MNIYRKYAPNVFVAECDEMHEKGTVIEMTLKYGGSHNAIVFNHLYSKGEKHYFSVVREDGFNFKEWAERKAEKYLSREKIADQKSDEFYKKSHDATKFTPLGQPILVGHHSEKRHRRDLKKSWDAMEKSVEFMQKADELASKASYWQEKANTINLSMPESLEYYEFKLEEAEEIHRQYKSKEREQEHIYSMTYAKKDVNNFKKLLEEAKKLWA